MFNPSLFSPHSHARMTSNALLRVTKANKVKKQQHCTDFSNYVCQSADVVDAAVAAVEVGVCVCFYV